MQTGVYGNGTQEQWLMQLIPRSISELGEFKQEGTIQTKRIWDTLGRVVLLLPFRYSSVHCLEIMYPWYTTTAKIQQTVLVCPCMRLPSLTAKYWFAHLSKSSPSSPLHVQYKKLYNKT